MYVVERLFIHVSLLFYVEIAQGKKVVPICDYPSTPSSATSGLLLTSTPTSSAAVGSPSSLSPLLHSQASPLALAAAFNQLKAAVAASPIGVANSPGQNARSSQITLASPQAVTALVNEALKGARSGAMALSLQPTSFTSSSQLGLQTNTMSPLLKSVGSDSPVNAGASPCAPIPNGSPQVMKSPAPKIVTVSKLPATMTTPNDHIASLLQSLQQSSMSLSKTTVGLSEINGHTTDVDSTAPLTSNGSI